MTKSSRERNPQQSENWCRNPTNSRLEECAGIMLWKYLMAFKALYITSLGFRWKSHFLYCVLLIGRDKVRKMREKFTASVWERSMIVLMHWRSCATHRSAVMCKGLWGCRPYCSPNQNSGVAEEATRLSCSADICTHLFLHLGSAECL